MKHVYHHLVILNDCQCLKSEEVKVLYPCTSGVFPLSLWLTVLIVYSFWCIRLAQNGSRDWVKILVKIRVEKVHELFTNHGFDSSRSFQWENIDQGQRLFWWRHIDIMQRRDEVDMSEVEACLFMTSEWSIFCFVTV